jgi:2-polyprenyl-6-methoxyphenol hydroxylase-like FAD-dependent oxidoreductase
MDVLRTVDVLIVGAGPAGLVAAIVTVTVQHPVSGRIPIRAGYVIGADGARSTTHATIQVPMENPDDLASSDRVPSSARATARRPTIWAVRDYESRRRRGARISGRDDRWGFAREWRSGEARMVDADEDELAELLMRVIGTPTPSVLEYRSAFSFAAQIAQKYRDARVFLVGDAAHRMTPRGGTGMNTAIQDAHDLGWRLAWVLRGWANAELLESYELVRRPVGLHHVQRAGQPDGARRDADDALPCDLNGRVARRWIASEHGVISTLDLMTEGLTLLTGPDEPRWKNVDLKTRVPYRIHALGAGDAPALDIIPTGARLFGPAAREIAFWSDFDNYMQIAKAATWLAEQRQDSSEAINACR